MFGEIPGTVCLGAMFLLLAATIIATIIANVASAWRQRARGRKVDIYGDTEAQERALMAAGASEGVARAILAGNKINAIRALRDETGLGLKEAKGAIERMQDTLYRYEPWDTRPKA